MGDLVVFNPVLPWFVLVALAIVAIGLFWYAGRDALRIALVLAVLLVCLRPGVGDTKVRKVATSLQVMVVVDRTLSMTARDYEGETPRLDGVRADLRALVRSAPGARFGLITWGRDARLELPFTTDATAFDTAIASLAPEGPFDGSGTNPDRPQQVLEKTLADNLADYPKRQRAVVFVSDGENTSDDEQGSFAALKKLVNGGLVLGYGTEQGGQMYLDPPSAPGADAGDDSSLDGGTSDDRLGPTVTGPDGKPALSKLGTKNLQRIAGQMGLRYFHRTKPGGMKQLLDSLSLRTTQSSDRSATVTKYDATWIAALLVFVLGLLDLLRSWRGMALARREERLP